MSELRVVENERKNDVGPRLNVDRDGGADDTEDAVASLEIKGCLERNEGIRIELELSRVVEVKNR